MMFKKHIEEVKVFIYDLPMFIGSWCFNQHLLLAGYDMHRFNHAAALAFPLNCVGYVVIVIWHISCFVG
jgi:hypothetical protein